MAKALITHVQEIHKAFFFRNQSQSLILSHLCVAESLTTLSTEYGSCYSENTKKILLRHKEMPTVNTVVLTTCTRCFHSETSQHGTDVKIVSYHISSVTVHKINARFGWQAVSLQDIFWVRQILRAPTQMMQWIPTPLFKLPSDLVKTVMQLI